MRGVALFALVAVASLQPVPSEAPVGSRVVPCERRSAVASGRRLASFARFATVDTDPHANAADGAVIDACDLSRELLVRLLREEDIDRLIAPLPPKFFHNRSAVSEECAQIAGVGKKIAAGLVEYQADCFRILHGGANCSLKLQLGGIWDDLLDTPFDWTGKGLQSCKDYSAAFGDYTVDSTYKCSFCSDANGTQPTACASPALVRLSVCASEAWWPEAAAAAYEAISMCQSSASCASLCYGYTSWNTTRREAAKNKLPTLGAGGAPSRAKASLIDALVLVKRYLLPIGDVVDVCVADQNCPDKSLVTTVNVTTNVCDVSCPAYAQTMQKLTSAADLLLPAEYGATLESFCPKVELDSSCLVEMQLYADMCSRPAFWDLCDRQVVLRSDPSLQGRAYESCSQPSVSEFFDRVKAVNTACQGQPAYQNLSDRGGILWGNATNIAWEDLCIISGWWGAACAIVSGVIILAMGVILAILARRRRFPQWFTVADFTSDICRSRTFTVTSFTWLLFSFYTLLTDYFVSEDSGTYRRMITELRVPMALYFLLLSLMMIPHFVILLIANNPFRHGSHYFVTSCVGLVLQHVTAVSMISIKVSKLATTSSVTTNSEAPSSGLVLQQSIAIDISFCVLLLLAMDVSFVQMARALMYEDFSFFDHFKRGCLRFTKSKFADARGVSKPSISSKAVLHLVLPRASLPSHDELSGHLAFKVFGGMVDSHRLLVTNIERLMPDGSGTGPECHPDFVPAVTASGKEQSAHLKLRDLQTPGAWPWSRMKTTDLPVEPSQMVLQVEVLVLGQCTSLMERRWLCEMLEVELKKQQVGHGHIVRALVETRRALPTADEGLVEILLERLNTKALQGLTLRGADRMRALDTNIVVELQIKFGATYAALRETILEEAYSSVKVVARKGRRDNMLEYLNETGVSAEHAEILLCLPDGDFEELRADIEQVKHLPDREVSLQECIMQKISSLFAKARDRLISQLSNPSFRTWLSDNQKSLDSIGVANHLPAAPDCSRDYPLSALFAFFAAGAGHDLTTEGKGLSLSPKEIIQQLIRASHAQLSALATKRFKSDSSTEEAYERASAEETEAQGRTRVLKKFRRTVHIAMTLTNNPLLVKERALHRKETLVGDGQHESKTHLVSVLEDAPGSQSVSSTKVVLIRPEKLSAMNEAKKQNHAALWVPTIIFICAVLSMLLVTRTFCNNMISLAGLAEWLLGIVATLHQTCDRVEMLGDVSVAVFQCFTPDKLRAIVESDASAELQKSVSDLMELRNSDEVAGAATSIAAVQKITENVDFAAMQQDLQAVSQILVKVQELQAAAQTVPPDVSLIQAKSAEIDSDVRQVQGSITRLQDTAQVVAASQDDLKQVIEMTQDVQNTAAKIEPLVEPLEDIFMCATSAMGGMNWSLFLTMSDSQTTAWEQLFLDADADSGGVLNKSEYAQIAWLANNMTAVSMSNIDVDKSDAVETNEWKVYQTNGGALAGAQSDSQALADQSVADIEVKLRECRTFVRKQGCVKELREYLPRSRTVRESIRPMFADDDSIPSFRLQPEVETALPKACELYRRVGCEAPSMQFLLVNGDVDLAKWREGINNKERQLNNTLWLVRENAKDLETFTNYALTPATVIGNLIALVMSALLTRRMILRFRSAVWKIRNHHAEGRQILEVVRRAKISSVNIPKLVGLTLFSWLINFFIISFLASTLFAILLGPWLWKGVFSAADQLVGLAIETVMVVVVIVVFLDMVVGKLWLLGGTEDLKHPVFWTWYACVMLVFNIAKGAALAVTRIVYMVLLNFCQFAIVDKTVFPLGTEGMDPAYASFVGTVHFASKYRHPIVTSLFLSFFAERDAAQPHSTSDTDERALEEIGLASHSRDGNERASARETQDSGRVMSLKTDIMVCNMVCHQSDLAESSTAKQSSQHLQGLQQPIPLESIPQIPTSQIVSPRPHAGNPRDAVDWS